MHGRRLLAALGLVAVATVLAPSPAEGHPFGPPQTATIALDDADGVVRVHWQPGAPDDYTYLAVGLGLSAEDLSQDPGGLLAVKKDADLLTASPDFERYLRRHVTVSDEDGGRCDSTVEPVEHLVADGVQLTFDCGRTPEAVDVDLSLLTDLHPAYQTLASGPQGQRFAYTATATSHGWSFRPDAASPELGRSAATQLSVVLGGLVLVVAAPLLALRRTRRKSSS